MQSCFIGMTLENVVRYIDREYGEEIRQKTIEGWKDAKFSYGVKFHFLNEFSSGRLVCKNKKLMCYGDTQDDVLTFQTETEASAFIDEVNNKAKEYYKKYLNLKKECGMHMSDDDYNHIFKPFFNKIEGFTENGLDSLYWNVFVLLVEEEKTGNPKYKLEVVQVVIH